MMKGLRQAHTRYTVFIQGNDLPSERSVYLVRARARVKVEVRVRVTVRVGVRVRLGVRVWARVRVRAQRAPIAEERDGHEVQHRKAEDERVEEGRLAINEPG